MTTIKQQLDTDIKTAMLAGEKTLVTTLRGLKSAILYAEVAAGNRDTGGISDEAIVDLFTKEAKKRQESADLYLQGGNAEKAAAEQAEREVIMQYLPAQMDDAELEGIIRTVITDLGASGLQAMGQVIAKVKSVTAGKADGGRIAAKVKGML